MMPISDFVGLSNHKENFQNNPKCRCVKNY